MSERVYALYSPAWGQMIKIGCTTRTVEERIAEGQTWCPTIIRAACVILVDNCHEVERRIHEELTEFRQNGEFFRLDLPAIRRIMENHGMVEGEGVPDEILGHREVEGNLEFEVRWEGYRRTTWEPLESLVHLRILRLYRQRHGI